LRFQASSNVKMDVNNIPHTSGDRLSSKGISQTMDDPSRQSQPLTVPPGIPYPSIVGSGAMPNVAGATNGRREGDEGIIDDEGTLPEQQKSRNMPDERAIPSRQVQDRALLSDNEPLADTSLHFEKQTLPTHARDGSHAVQMSEKPRRASNSNTSSSDTESTNEKSSGRGKKSKKAKKTKEAGVKPVSIFQLYRFHTPAEKAMNIGALVLAAAAGATQPLMT
jgi:hypothetical protein